MYTDIDFRRTVTAAVVGKLHISIVTGITCTLNMGTGTSQVVVSTRIRVVEGKWR